MLKFKVPNEVLPIAQFLRNLDLANNRIQQLPTTNFFSRMQILKTLNLSNNKIGKWECMLGIYL